MKCRIYKISLRSFKIKINKILELSNNFKITCSTTSQATKGCPSRTLWIPKPKARTWQSHLVIFLSKIPVDGSQRQGIKSTTTPKWASVAHITTNNWSNRNIHRTPSAANSILPRAERGWHHMIELFIILSCSTFLHMQFQDSMTTQKNHNNTLLPISELNNRFKFRKPRHQQISNNKVLRGSSLTRMRDNNMNPKSKAWLIK